MQNQIENQIKDSENTINLCKLILRNEVISESTQELIHKRIEVAELNLKILELELSKPKFEDVLFNICNPSLS